MSEEKNKGYLEIAEHYLNCYKEHGDNHLGMDWPDYEDTIIRNKIMYELIQPQTFKNITDSTLLDFGCGTGHFYEWLITNHDFKPKYSGLDINQEFIYICKQKFPGVDFIQHDILTDINLCIPNYDYVIMNGVFTEKRTLTQSEMILFFTQVIRIIWGKTNKGIAFNLMSDYVDWKREDLFHVPLNVVCEWLTKNISRDFVIKHGYGGLYEYTVYVYKDKTSKI